uniref:Uncharacterized protein n=1 Tax=Romanomermis culicivorax TaxID=13658 RepID=A0A915J252_ROMCU
MGGVNGVDDAELLSPQAGDPSQYQWGHVMRDGWLLFSVRGAIVFTKILVQRERGVRCPNVHGHGDANTKAAEKVDQNHFMQRTRREKFNRWINTRWVAGQGVNSVTQCGESVVQKCV